MFKKIRSFFSKKKETETVEPVTTNQPLRQRIGTSIYPIMEQVFRRNEIPPAGISHEDWRKIKETILWSFSALRTKKQPLNNILKSRRDKKIKEGLILFAHHIDNLEL